MKVAEAALSLCVVGLACFIGQELRAARTVVPQTAALMARTSAGTVDSDSAPEYGVVGSDPYERPVVVVRTSVSTEPALDPRELRRRLFQGGSGTYVNDLLRARDSALARWPARTIDPLRVWISEPLTLDGWDPAFPASVRDAFDSWSQIGIPVRFSYVRDSASADVHVRFLTRFPTGISGKTIWSRDSQWWLVSGDITLAVAHPSGGVVTPPQMRAITLHEVGHLLGLDHTDDQSNIMSARIRVRDLSDADRATVRLLYSVPAGSAK